MSNVTELQELGQSIWLDYIERNMVNNGELAQEVKNGVTGVTSNPTIFEKAITGGNAYDEQLERLVGTEQNAKTIFETLAIADIQAAADVLRPVYNRTDGQDGFVSIEVAPDLASDTKATVNEGRRLFKMVNRPNLMVKVPATEAGIDAIRQLISDGINVNVTLIFSLERYAAVQEAYIQGLEERVKQGKPIDSVASVASFFVSRVDANIDDRLNELAEANPDDAESLRALRGKAAIANAKLAYDSFQEIFSGERWQRLVQQGAKVQRPLWASTSTKDPAYSDVLYVESLIGPNTVNTLPPKTLKAFRDHGQAKRTVDQNVDEARQQLDAIRDAGIDMDEVTHELEREGVQKFADSYNSLLDSIEQQREQMVAMGD